MTETPAVDARGTQRQLRIAAFGAVLTLALVGLGSVGALAIFLLEGLVSLAVLAAAALAGGWIVRWIGLRSAPWGERLIIGAALGCGLLSLLVLGLGVFGLLQRPLMFAGVVVMAAAGIARLLLDLHENGWLQVHPPAAGGTPAPPSRPTPSSGQTSLGTIAWLWLLLCPFLAIMLLAAALPPGVLWIEEGLGYDVLEYHLAVPKEFCEAGRMGFLPHNVYSNFPLNSEMLSLLMMVLRGDAIEAAFMAVTANVGLAILFIAAAWMAARQFSTTVGLVAGVLAGTTPWIAYLAGIAYVEPGMLAMGMAAMAAGLKVARSETLATRWALTAGLLAGLACGFKYTAVPLIAAPLGILMLARPKSSVSDAGASENLESQGPVDAEANGRYGGRPLRPGGGPRLLALYALGAVLTFSPWLIRNVANTGNPCFPLAYDVFKDRSGSWDAALNERWERAHGSADAEQTLSSLPARIWYRTAGDFRMGILALPLAIVGAVRRRDRWTLVLLIILALQFGVWLLATHLFARFAVVMLLPLLLLAGRAPEGTPASMEVPRTGSSRPLPCEQVRHPNWWPKWMVAALVIGTGLNLYRLGTLYYDHGGVAIGAYGQTRLFVEGHWPDARHWAEINALGPDSRTLLVGEARTFYARSPVEYATVFNRHPLAEVVRAAQDPREVIDWLWRRGTTHVLVNWVEVRRLADTYGFYPALDPQANPGIYNQLETAGLVRVADFAYQEGSPAYATLYKVTRP